MKQITMFSWGYYGWGNATTQLVKAVDAAEISRGFEPPIFVDIRIHRTVRAKGFQGNNFEKLLGSNRYRWMKSLGNKSVQTRTGKGIQIAKPSAAEELLDFAIESAVNNHRILFFCSCPWPIACHRTKVARLVLKATMKRAVPLEIVEWPGGKPVSIELEVNPEFFSAVRRGRMTIPLMGNISLGQVACLPLGSIATLYSGHEKLHRIVGPAIWQKKQWILPVLGFFDDPDIGLSDYKKKADELRRGCGLLPISSR